ncbi:hypothetical protein KN1_08740 [Stygiolobus caldivivus]|uniref:PIN domain-containing protein n=1 Tax=Stygiolobus caldivivus TaxID=2824673 RepID=A0A8D5U5W7_9CREN|nr:hypothetical protein KN1_08740 [Stygiolobus caldivivus]
MAVMAINRDMVIATDDRDFEPIKKVKEELEIRGIQS